ncbi:MAG TPA: dihydroneopterin aldolase [Chloroflexi bacterium]|nr:dihydroneopterin aldolase [Chloroflexota bacterium]
MLDRINITDLHLRTIIGINPEERTNLQDVLINITLFVNTKKAGETDEINDAANYRTITKNVINLVENSQFFLVEKMASEISKICLSNEKVVRCIINVQKPSALRFARSVGITIERNRSSIDAK